MAQEEQDVFKDVKVLTISEVFVLFERNMDVWRRRDPDYQPSAMLQKAAEYAGRFATNKNKDTVQKIREMLAARNLSELELGLVANLAIETPDEARKLVPTLEHMPSGPSLQRHHDEELDARAGTAAQRTCQRYSDEELDSMLRELATYREFE